VWEVEYSCAAHSDRKFRFLAPDFATAFAKARLILEGRGEHGVHSHYTHWPPKRLDYVTSFEDGLEYQQ